jgi:hypothetical protein
LHKGFGVNHDRHLAKNMALLAVHNKIRGDEDASVCNLKNST